MKNSKVRTRTVYQMEMTECGAASLAMVLGYYGKWITLEQARSALRLGQQKAPQRWYHLFDDYRMEYVLEMLRTQGSGCLIPHPALGILRASDVQYGTEFIGTLRAYFEAGRNMTAAADRIFIHRTSFCRRMDRIRELSGIDPGDSDAMLELELALRLEDPWGQIPRLP